MLGEILRWIRIGVDQESMAQQRKGMCAGGNTEVDTYWSRSREHGTAEKGYVYGSREHDNNITSIADSA